MFAPPHSTAPSSRISRPASGAPHAPMTCSGLSHPPRSIGQRLSAPPTGDPSSRRARCPRDRRRLSLARARGTFAIAAAQPGSDRYRRRGTVIMTAALVTGGAGLIGSHIVDLLVGEGWGVRVLDNYE